MKHDKIAFSFRVKNVDTRGKKVKSFQFGNIRTLCKKKMYLVPIVRRYFDLRKIDTRSTISLHLRSSDNRSHYVRHPSLHFESFEIPLECLSNPRFVFHGSFVGY